MLRILPRIALLLIIALLTPCAAGAPNFADQIARPLRYRPEGNSFVIENGGEVFNRPLYGFTSAFRIDAGDRPEFSLYLPGRGGNLRLGVRTGAASGAANGSSMRTRSSPATKMRRCVTPSATRCLARESSS